MFKWGHIPLVRVAAVFSAGILLGIYQFGWINVSVAVLLSIAFFIVGSVFFMLRKKNSTTKILAGLFGFSSLFFLGYTLVNFRTASSDSNNIILVKNPIVAYRAIVEGHLEEKKNSFKTTVKIKQIKTDSGWMEASGKVNLYIAKNSFRNNIQWGDEMIVIGHPQEIQPPSNPHEFDFKRFLSFKNIYHQQFIQGDAFRQTGFVEKGFLHYSARARTYFSGIIKKYVLGEQEEAISLALVIGVTDGIDDELVSAYSASGAMHVLAVSGLHVGIIYWMILLILKPLQKNRKGQWIVAVVSLLILWGYSFVTGLSPSVLRAVTMFSFVAVAKPLNIRSNIFNTLAASAFILLLFDPYLIMSVGFQLSYLAVLGIIWIQRPLYQLWEAKSWLTDQIWKITCVSIAAQATTFSLGLLYFHQFPTYFLISNLIVIPVSFVVLIAGIVLIIVSAISPLAQLVGEALHWSSWFLNQVVFVVEDWPLSIINNIYIDVFQSWLIMGIVASLIFVFQFKNIKWLYAGLTLSIFLSIVRWIHFNEQMDHKSFMVNNVSGKLVMEFMDGNRSFIMSDSIFLKDEERVRFHIRPNRLYNLVNQSEELILSHSESFQAFEYANKKFLVINHPFKRLPQEDFDYIIIASKAAWKTSAVIANYHQSQIILDSSWGRGQLNWLKREIRVLPKNVHVITEQGFFNAEL